MNAAAAGPAAPIRDGMRQHMAAGRWPAAAALAERWLAAGGSDWSIRLNGAVSRCRADPAAAEVCLVEALKALRQSGSHPQGRLGVAEIALAAGQWEQALAVLEGLAMAGPLGGGPLLQLRVRALVRLQREPEALAALEQVPPPQRDSHWALTLADLHIQACRWAEAEQLLRQVLAWQPELAEAHHNLALVLLSQQRCTEAWPHYEWRPGNPRRQASNRPRPLPALNNLVGRRVRVVGEQGIGDQLMVARYLPALASIAAAVEVEPAARLVPLLRRWLGEQQGRLRIVAPGETTAAGDEASPHHEAAPLTVGSASLPLLLWPALGLAPPPHHQGLRADPQRQAAWQQRLARLFPDPAPRLGLGWLGGCSGTEWRERALNPADRRWLCNLPGLHWIDLQYLGPAAAPAAEAIAGLLRCPAVGHDLEDTLALMACLDGVVTTRQTVAHLAGALGLTGQVLVPARPEWRYWGAHNRWAWYPSMQLLHQQHRGSWQQELERVRQHWAGA